MDEWSDKLGEKLGLGISKFNALPVTLGEMPVFPEPVSSSGN